MTPGCDSPATLLTKAWMMPFVASAIGHDDRVATLVERLVREVPCRELTFAPDPSFVDLLRPGPSRRD